MAFFSARGICLILKYYRKFKINAKSKLHNFRILASVLIILSKQFNICMYFIFLCKIKVNQGFGALETRFGG